MMKAILLRLSALVLFLLLGLFWLAPHARSSSRLRSKKQHRIAIVIPFVGEGPESIPPFLDLFCAAASGSSDLVDFLIFHNGVLDSYSDRDNIKFRSTDFSERFLRVLDEAPEPWAVESSDIMSRILRHHIRQYPYVLVEFKPALGHVFDDYLTEYTHWGYSDLDILFGDLSRWIVPQELEEYDIVTYGYGDQDRVYLRGQFTFHKNVDYINQLWRQCSYLSRMDQRFAKVLAGETKLRFESAEGCYSSIVLQQKNIKVKYAVKAFTDVDETDPLYTHGLYMMLNSHQSVLYISSDHQQSAQGYSLFEDPIYSDPKQPIQWEVGQKQIIQLNEDKAVKCMFWAQEKYQSRLCVDDVSSQDTVFWINGQLYKQPYENAVLPHVVTAPFFHFQEWKRYYRSAQLATFHRDYQLPMSFLLAKEGVIPIYPLTAGKKAKKLQKTIKTPLGIPLFKWRGIKNKDRSQLPSTHYCLQSAPRKFPPIPPAPQCMNAVSWQDDALVEIVSGAPGWNRNVDVDCVTLALTLQVTPAQATSKITLSRIMDTVSLNLHHWQGQPCVLVIHVAGATPESSALLHRRLDPESDPSYEKCLVAIIAQPETDLVSRKALVNMAVDAAPTRWVVSGVEMERGMVISKDTAFLAHRTSRTHHELRGNVFLIPQFALATEDAKFTLASLEDARLDGELGVPSTYEKAGCHGDSETTEHVLQPAMDMWWELTKARVLGGEGVGGKLALEQLAKDLNEFQTSLMSLLTSNRHYELFSMDVSPILMMDNMGPLVGMVTSQAVREVEEFGGMLCYNGLRLAQLATYGYTIDLLPGAFAASNTLTRFSDGSDNDEFLGASRCDGCFMFDEEHESILEALAKDERQRPAKAAVLWEEIKAAEQY